MGFCGDRQSDRDQPAPARGTYVVRLYHRIKRAKNHQKAVVAVGRHLAEAAWWVLTRQEIYREPQNSRVALSSTHG